ncbi:MAG: hypothetical protein RL745_106 [Actinomycetota bacterium]
MSASPASLRATKLNGVVGAKTASALSKMGVTTVEDLLRHYPRRYLQRGQMTDLGSLSVGDSATVFAEVASVDARPMRNRRGTMVEVVVTDGRARLSLTFFGQQWLQRQFTPGRQGMFAGTVTEFRGSRQLSHPEYVLAPMGDELEQEQIDAFAGAIIPVYPASSSMPSWRVSASVDLVLPFLDDVEDPLPEEVRSAQALPNLRDALRWIHRPQSMEEVNSATIRLKFDEAFLLQLELLRRRAAWEAETATSLQARAGGLVDAFDSSLPYSLTAGQVEVSRQISDDLQRSHPMHRLLQGEVGSGKTVVALRAMLTVVDAGAQAALLAPTEVLATQHYRSITGLLGSLAGEGLFAAEGHGVTVTLLTGSMSTAARRQAMLDIASGQAGIVIGTHALIQESVQFAQLALVVVDEQHRFGVEQRARLAAKSGDLVRPHMLTMTATPIPRTVALALFADMDISTLTELPAGRAPITTHVVAALEQPAHLTRVWSRIIEEVGLGRKAYVVCSRIGADRDGAASADADFESAIGAPADAADAAETKLPAVGVVELFEKLSSGELAELRVAILHGRLPESERSDAMRRFALPAGDADAYDVLVATTVIEVGVDVPSASVMAVMDADRFGVSQLHQLRGRVGRGGLPGLCLLVTNAPSDSPARERLAVVASTIDGFELSEYDLKTRREGDVLGADQSGRRSTLRLLEVVEDLPLVETARSAAMQMISDDPTLARQPLLRAALDDALADRADYLEKS